MSIDTERSDLDELERKLAATLNIGGRLKTTLRKNWLYSFDKVVDANCHEKVDPECDERKATCAALLPPECTAKQAVDRLAEDLKGFVEEVNLLKSAPEGLAEANAKTKKMQADLAEFNAMYRPESGTSLMADANTVAGNVARTAANTDLLQSSSSGYDFGNAAADFLKKVKTIQDFVLDVKESESYTHHDLAEITLPMAAYRQKPMTETITCKDALSGVQAFDSMIFTAFYENTPRFDISAGAIMSFLPGRQVGAVSCEYGSTLTNAAGIPLTTCLAVTSTTRPQFMPAAFFEYHPVNKKCPWATNGGDRHPFGYVCSLGLAGGISVNPNNGTASAEFFEGVSFAIQRVSFLFGIHNGRYQTFADGYYVGEALPGAPGQTTARTERIWTNHFAIGIAYRPPLR